MNISIELVNGKLIFFEVLGFSGGERHIQLNNLPKEPPGILTIRAYIRSSNDLMDLLLIDNALKNHYTQPVGIRLELPYLPYARQDRVCAEGQAFSLELMADLLKLMNITQLVTWDCHSQIGISLTNAINVQPTQIVKSCDKLLAFLQHENSILICPDEGAINRCEQLKNELALHTMILCEKKRNPNTGEITHTDVLADEKYLHGKIAIISDDICDGGYTFIKIAEQLKNKHVEKIILFVTHGIFSKGIDIFDGLIDEIFATQSFPHAENKKLNIINFNYTFGE